VHVGGSVVIVAQGEFSGSALPPDRRQPHPRHRSCVR
jgi:hypothetical protein